MRVNLKVPFEQRHEVRQLGAKWDEARKTWYVENVPNIADFLKWMPAHLTRPHVPNGLLTGLRRTEE